MARSRRARAALAAAALVAAGCASRAPTSEDYASALVTAAASDPALPAGARLVPVLAGSEAEALKAVVQATGAGPSELSRSLARAFASGADGEVGFVVGGPYDALNERVVLDAFSLARRPLPGLYLLYVSPEAPSAELLRGARTLSVRVGHRPLELPPR